MAVALAAVLTLAVAADPYVQDGYNPPEVKTSKVEASPTTTVAPAPIEQSAYRGMGNRTSDVEQWRPLVNGHFSDLGPEAVERALVIMACESGGNQFAANPNSAARGLMQIMASVWAPEFDLTWDQLYEPEINLWVARQVYDRQGWNAWMCWRR